MYDFSRFRTSPCDTQIRPGDAPVVADPTVIIAWERLPTWPESMSLLPMCAPWHPAGEPG